MNEITPSQIYSAVEIRYNTTILGIYEYPRVLNIAQPIRNYCNAFIRGAVINNYYLVRIAFLLFSARSMNLYLRCAKSKMCTPAAPGSVTMILPRASAATL